MSIESWHRQGFEHHLIERVKVELDDAHKRHEFQMKEVQSEIRHLKKRIDHINGFYVWLIDTYPETVAQYKALIDLHKTSNPESEGESVPMQAGP